MSLLTPSSMSERDTTDSEGGAGAREGEELSDGLLESDSADEGGGGGGSGVGWEGEPLDFEDLMEDAEKPTSRVCEEEEEVKVHATGVIEEGKLSSGEEGEIKDESEESSVPTQQPSPQPTALATPTGDHGNSNDKPASLTESDSEVGAEVKGEGEGQGGRRDDNSAKEEVAASPTVGEVESASKEATAEATPTGAVCRHFLQGKCSWGRECRFLHDDSGTAGQLASERASSLQLHMGPRPRFPPSRFPPPHGPRFLRGPPQRFMMQGEPFMHPPGPDFMRMPPHGPSSHRPARGGFERAQLYMSYEQQAGAGGKPGVSQVAEESEGWYRLRTVATHWSSDEEQTTPRSVKDLRDKLKKSMKRSESPEPLPVKHQNHDSGDEAKPRRKKRTQRPKMENSGSPGEHSESESGPERRRSHKSHSGHSDSKKKQQRRLQRARELSSGSDTASPAEELAMRPHRKTAGRKRKKRHRSSSTSSVEDARGYRHDEYPYHLPPFLPSPHRLPLPPQLHLHGPPGERMPPHHIPPGSRIPPHHRHPPIDSYGPPPLPPHPQGRYSDRYGPPPPYRGYEWHGPPRSPPPRNYRDFHPRPRTPSPEREPHRPRRARQQNQSSDSSSECSPEQSQHRQHHGKSSADRHKDKTLNRKEKLLQELSAINEVIERKKLKKHSH